MKKLLIFFVLIVFVGCGGGDKLTQINYLPNAEEAPDILIENMNSIYKSESKLKAKIKAPISQYFYKSRGNPYMEFPQGIYAEFFDENMKLISKIKADYAVYYETKKLWKLVGNVEVLSNNGGKLRTQELYYDEDKELLFSIKFVEVYDTTGSIIRGKGGFVSDLKFSNYEFKNVDGIIITTAGQH